MAILKLTDICKDYQQGKEPVRVLKNIDLTVEKGEYLAIVDLLAARRGITLPQEELHSQAIAWERFHGAQTPRTALQFILSL